MAKASGGVERLAMAGLFADAPESSAAVALAPALVVLALALLLAEVFLRRFFSGRPRRARFTPAPMPAVRVAPQLEQPAPAPAAAESKSALETAMERAKKRTRPG